MTKEANNIYKIFSDEPLDDNILENLFVFEREEATKRHEEKEFKENDEENNVNKKNADLQRPQILATKRWKAYPEFNPKHDTQDMNQRNLQSISSFYLDEEEDEKERSPIFYTGCLESTVSAMEINCIAGKNVAFLVGDYLRRLNSK